MLPDKGPGIAEVGDILQIQDEESIMSYFSTQHWEVEEDGETH